MNAPMILDGTALARKIEAQLKARTAKITEKLEEGKQPLLATILVGDDPASAVYVKMKRNACKRAGLGSLSVKMAAQSTTAEVLAQIEKLNSMENVYGILLQHPVPAHIDEQKCFNTISLDKDVDGVNTGGFGAMTMGLDAFKPATPFAIMSLLQHYGITVEGKEAVVIGRSPILGKPVAMLLLNANATVTICHSKTVDLPAVVRRADIVVAAVGKPKFVKADWIKEGAVLIDAGYNPGNIGDIDMESASLKSSAYTPVPGGVGPVTIIKLMEQTVESAEKKLGIIQV